MADQAKKLTYESAGVSIEEGDALVSRLAKTNKAIGGFSGAFPLDVAGMKKPQILAATDGVGTKLLIAQKTGKHDTIGIDLVAMVVNDLIVCGAKPLFFLDYYATGKLTKEEGDGVLSGIQKGCEIAGIPLIGGETAEMPGLYEPGHFDLAGFGVGVIDEENIIDGSQIKEGDAVIGISSSGVHSNGFSLVRAVIDHAGLSYDSIPEFTDQTLGDVLLTPTNIYVEFVLKLQKQIKINAMCHNTGGGLKGNLERVLPEHIDLEVDRNSWKQPDIFPYLRTKGNIDKDEMFKVFNMGIGYIVITDQSSAEQVMTTAQEFGFEAWNIGKAIKGSGKVNDQKTGTET